MGRGKCVSSFFVTSFSTRLKAGSRPALSKGERLSQRPEINPFINVIAKWIFHNIVKPTGLNSPNGMFNYRLGKEEQWILEGV